METAPQSKNVSVLVPLDGSFLAEHAIPYARALAGPEGQVVFLEVIPEPEPIRGLLGDLIVNAEEAGEMYEEETITRLSETADRWKRSPAKSKSKHAKVRQLSRFSSSPRSKIAPT